MFDTGEGELTRLVARLPGALAGRPGDRARWLSPSSTTGRSSSPASTTPWPAGPTATATASRSSGDEDGDCLHRPGPLRPGSRRGRPLGPGPGHVPRRAGLRPGPRRSQPTTRGGYSPWSTTPPERCSDLVVLDATASGGPTRGGRAPAGPRALRLPRFLGARLALSLSPRPGSHDARVDRGADPVEPGMPERCLRAADPGRDRLEGSLQRPRLHVLVRLSGENDPVEFDVAASPSAQGGVETVESFECIRAKENRCLVPTGPDGRPGFASPSGTMQSSTWAQLHRHQTVRNPSRGVVADHSVGRVIAGRRGQPT